MSARPPSFGAFPRTSSRAPRATVVRAILLSAVAAGACAPASSPNRNGSGGDGSSSGGRSATGGSSSSGGRTGSGGTPASSGGAVGSGGVTGSGGLVGTGGGSGGTSGAAGGQAASGGSNGGAGTSASGGAGGGAMGSGGASGGSGGGTASACKTGPSTAPAGGSAYPFPQHRFNAACLYPATCKDADATAGWTAYKAHMLVDDADGAKRIQRPENQNDSVSEGIAYGLLFAVYMNEKDAFDALWKYEQKHLDATGLMNWHITSAGATAGGGANSATDSDEDMGFALVMADKQWGGYADVAKSFLSLVAKNDFESDGTIKGGDKYANAVNPSYLAPAYYRTFAKFTGDAKWTTILEKSYALLAAATNATNGLVPDWSSPAGLGPDYKYDAARTPFRIALDACWNNEPRAITFSKSIGKFFADIGAKNIKDGYSVSTGMSISTNVNATFIGPAGVAGMAASQTQLVSDAYAFVADTDNQGTESYYNMSWALFSTLMMTGNFVDFTAL